MGTKSARTAPTTSEEAARVPHPKAAPISWSSPGLGKGRGRASGQRSLRGPGPSVNSGLSRPYGWQSLQKQGGPTVRRSLRTETGRDVLRLERNFHVFLSRFAPRG